MVVVKIMAIVMAIICILMNHMVIGMGVCIIMGIVMVMDKKTLMITVSPMAIPKVVTTHTTIRHKYRSLMEPATTPTCRVQIE